MIINNTFKFIFVHIPKNAGTSLTQVLKVNTHFRDLEIGGTEFGEQIQPAYGKRFGLAKHSTAATIRKIVGEATWADYFTFAFVRNPFSRCLSTFHFLRKWEGMGQSFSTKMKSFSSFEEYVLSDIWLESDGPDNIFCPQCRWIKSPKEPNEILVKFVGRVEQIDKDVELIFQSIDHPDLKREGVSVPKFNISTQSSIIDIKNDAVIEKIIDKYKVDFETFGYSKSLS